MGLWTDIRDFFFPRLCPICERKLLPDEKGICTSCLLGLPFTHIGNCLGNDMEKNFWGRFPVQRSTSLFYYTKGSSVAHILHAMKYHHRPQLCKEMGVLMAQELHKSGFFLDIDYIVPVPLHRKRQQERGYNQSEQLAQGISLQTNLPICTTALARTRNNRTQTHKSGFERWQNTEQLFCSTPQAIELLTNKHILLIDDVLTTGATLVACADALSTVPDIRISVATLAWTR